VEVIVGKNVGPIDRLVRLGAALVAVVIALLVGAGSMLGIVLFAVGAILLVTAVVGFCPLYRLLGLSTSPASPAPKEAQPAAL
jgi:hypothetical protein